MGWPWWAGISRYVSAANYVNVVLGDHPIGYWRMNATSGTTEVDASGNGRTGTMVGGVTLGSPGAITNGDTSETFDGSTGEVTVGSGLTVSGACSFEAWIFDTSGALSDVKAIFSLNLGSHLFTMNASKQIKLSLNLSSGQKNITGASTLAANRWNHVVGTYDGADVITLYVNGMQDAQTAGLAGTLIAPGAITRHIGTDGNSVAARYWQGRLDEVAVYSVALTPAQIANHYATALL